MISLAALAAACVPDFVDDTTHVDAPRIVAIRSEPAEAAEREVVTLRALVVGSEESVPVQWSLCVDRKPLSELGPVSPRCLAGPDLDPEIAQSLGQSEAAVPAISATLPEIACQLFGPQRPDPKAGEPAGRPVDPDSTGGFYQPALAWLAGAAVLGGVRLTCPLSGATREGLVEFNRRYRRNENPEIHALELVRVDGSVIPLDAATATAVRANERVALRVTWPECPVSPVCGDAICGADEDSASCEEDCKTPRGCGGAERYVNYDHLAQIVALQQEAVTVSWYATAGRFDAPRTDSALDTAASSRNGFTAPTEGAVRIWAVVRDDRGGVTWTSAALSVQQ
ncbi:MAG: hypothetical protein ACOY0T_30360 [Myxococcota bacterium]